MWKNISNEGFYNGRKPEVKTKIFEKAMKDDARETARVLKISPSTVY